MDILALQDCGLTEAEAKVYLALLEIGSTTTGSVIAKTHLHKATVYLVLNKLQGKGLVSFIIKGGTKYFKAVSPDKLFNILKDKLANFEKILPELLQKERLVESKVSAEILIGKKAIISIYRDILKYKEYLTFGAGIPLVETLGPFYYQFQKEKQKLKIKSNILVSERIRGTNIQKTIYGNYKFLSKEFEGPANTLIYGNKLVIIIWAEEPTAFVLESKEAVNVYKKYFNVLWRIAKN